MLLCSTLLTPFPLYDFPSYRAFRRFLFLEDGKGEGASAVPTRVQIQSLPYFSALRPSTVLNTITARATSQMPLPYESAQDQDMTLQSYLEELTVTSEDTPSPEVSRDYAAGSFPALTTIRASYSDSWRTVSSEMASWQCVQSSLDVLVQRTAVAEGSQKATMRAWYDSISDIGTMYFR